MTILMMARKGKGKEVEKDKGKGKSKGNEKGKSKGKGKGKSTLALRDEPTDSDPTNAEEHVYRLRRPRSHSSGISGAKKPLKPQRINISDGQ